MQRTVNYDLCQYEGSDKTSYLINYNGDMLKIDAAIKGAKDAADNAQSKANTADGKADANALSISTLDTQINGAGGVAADVSSLQGSVNTINSLIGSGEPTTQDKTIIGAINELAGEIPQGGTSAADVSYNGTTSGLTADDVQEAIDEVVAMIPSVVTPDADDVSYDNTQSGLTATNVQDAIDEIANDSANFGTVISIKTHTTFANAYIAPSDGYASIYGGESGSSKPTLYVYGANATADNDPRIAIIVPIEIASAVFVRKGAKIVVNVTSNTDVSAGFIPFSN